MRIAVTAVLLLVPAYSFAQASPCRQHIASVSQFDPYNPSDAAIMRNYGATVLAQAPLEELRKLDPYVPSQAALLRQMGGAIPLWTFAAYPAFVVAPSPSPGPQGAPCEPMSESPTPVITTFHEVWAELERRGASSRATSAARTATAQTPAIISGVTIEHAGRVWFSAGPAVRFTESEFMRVGERSGSPIFQRAGGEDTVVYVPTTPGMVAPFRAVR